MPLVLFDSGSVFHTRWAAQYVAADPQNRKSVGVSGALGAEGVRNTIVQAVTHVTGDREIVFAVGHGGASDRLEEGTLDLAPAHKFRLAKSDDPAKRYVNPWYDFAFWHDGLKPQSDKQVDEALTRDSPMWMGAQDRLRRWGVYTSIGMAMKANTIYRVTFVTCRVGNALDFIKKISIDWGTLVKAYTRYVVYQLNGQTGRVRAFFEGDDPGKGSNVALAETQLPQQDFVTVGPPLPTPQSRP